MSADVFLMSRSDYDGHEPEEEFPSFEAAKAAAEQRWHYKPGKAALNWTRHLFGNWTGKAEPDTEETNPAYVVFSVRLKDKAQPTDPLRIASISDTGLMTLNRTPRGNEVPPPVEIIIGGEGDS